MLVAFVVTLAAGLMVKYGLHGFTRPTCSTSGSWSRSPCRSGYHLSHGDTNAWGQGLAWLIGSALTIAWTAIVWLARGRTARAQPVADIIPGSTKPVPLTRPVILFALIRAIATAICVAIAFGFHLPDADWMPIACLIAMKSSLAQTTLVALQRLAGAIIGAVVAAVFLLTVDTKIVLEVVTVIFGTLAGSIRAVNYALYCAALAAAVLIAEDLPHPTNLGHEGAGCCSPWLASGSPSSSCCWPACSPSAPPRRHLRHLRRLRRLFLKARPVSSPASAGGVVTGGRYQDLPPRSAGALVVWAVLRIVLIAAVLVVLYYVLPLDRPWDSDTAVRLLIGLLVFAGVMVWGVRTITGSRYPGVRAAEALALILPSSCCCSPPRIS